jgi:hypothetical protein
MLDRYCSLYTVHDTFLYSTCVKRGIILYILVFIFSVHIELQASQIFQARILGEPTMYKLSTTNTVTALFLEKTGLRSYKK